MEYGYSILMGIFAGTLSLYAGFMALFKDYKMLPFRATQSVKPKNEKVYMTQLAKVIALVACSPALSSVVGLWNMTAALIVLITTGVIFIWLGTKLVKNAEGKNKENKDYYFRVISNQVRFGCGYRNHNGHRQYFAWHGYPNQNSDYITTSEISEDEFKEINKNYPKEIVANREKAEVFRNRYVDNHPMILEGWDRLL